MVPLYTDISHFRAPYKNSVISGFGSAQGCHGIGCAGYGAAGFGVLEISQQVQGLKALLERDCAGTYGTDSFMCRQAQYSNAQSGFNTAVEIMLSQRMEAGYPTEGLVNAIAKEVMYQPGYESVASAKTKLGIVLGRAQKRAAYKMKKNMLFQQQGVAPVSQQHTGTITSPHQSPLQPQQPQLYSDEGIVGKTDWLLIGGVALAGAALLGGVYYFTQKPSGAGGYTSNPRRKLRKGKRPARKTITSATRGGKAAFIKRQRNKGRSIQQAEATWRMLMAKQSLRAA